MRRSLMITFISFDYTFLVHHHFDKYFLHYPLLLLDMSLQHYPLTSFSFFRHPPSFFISFLLNSIHFRSYQKYPRSARTYWLRSTNPCLNPTMDTIESQCGSASSSGIRWHFWCFTSMALRWTLHTATLWANWGPWRNSQMHKWWSQFPGRWGLPTNCRFNTLQSWMILFIRSTKDAEVP